MEVFYIKWKNPLFFCRLAVKKKNPYIAKGYSKNAFRICRCIRSGEKGGT
jgi:hypothetical protein